MTSVLSQVYVSLVFPAVNVLVLCSILALNRRGRRRVAPSPVPELPPSSSPPTRPLEAKDILGWEFDYAKTTATQAMQDRHTMVNFYLLVVGVVASAVVALLGKDFRLHVSAGTWLLWLLCGIGWLYFLKLIRLRQAWHDSLRAMNQIKEFYIQHVDKLNPEVLRTAFRWQSHTLPGPDQPWTVFFYSGMLIALLDSVAYMAGGALLCLDSAVDQPGLLTLVLGTAGLLLFAFHVWVYFAFLKPETFNRTLPRGRNEDTSLSSH